MTDFPLQFCQSDDDDHDDDAADESRQDAPEHYEGEQGTCSWDELLYQMTHGALGLKPTRGTSRTPTVSPERKPFTPKPWSDEKNSSRRVADDDISFPACGTFFHIINGK